MAASAITGLKVLSGRVRPEIMALGTMTRLEIEDAPLGGGGFGQNHPCATINGAPPPVPLLVKLLKEDGKGSLAHAERIVPELIRRLDALDADRKRQGLPPLAAVPSLLAVPLFWFAGTWRGQPVRGYAALRLDPLGYRPFDRFTDGDPGAYRAHQNTKPEKKFRMAADLAEGIEVLGSIGFLHGDLNPENLFVNLPAGRAALIDFDSGGIGGQPYTWGKPGSDWIAPEILAALAAGDPRPAVTPASEAWSVGIGVHYLLYLCHPLSYLRDLGGATLAAYFAAERWPQIDPRSPLRHTGNIRNQPKYARAVSRLQVPVANACRALLNDGALDPAKRPAPAVWRRVLTGPVAPPAIGFFGADQPAVLAGDPVTLVWTVDRAERIEIAGAGDVTGKRQHTLILSADATFTLVATNVAGEARRDVPVRVVLPPVLTGNIPLPPCQIGNLLGLGSLPPFAAMPGLPSLPPAGVRLPRLAWPRFPVFGRGAPAR